MTRPKRDSLSVYGVSGTKFFRLLHHDGKENNTPQDITPLSQQAYMEVKSAFYMAI